MTHEDRDSQLPPPGSRRTIEVDPQDGERVRHYKDGADRYVASLPEWARYYLYTKPYCTIEGQPEPTHSLYLHDAVNILNVLKLPGGSRVLDVACGPGWMSEFLYRYGYDVTGVDLSQDLLEVAQARIDKLPHPPADRDAGSVRFRRLDIETERLEEEFDAILFYDCLHHFIDAEAIFDNVASMLAPGGQLLIKEGAMPPRGSAGEKALIEESERFQTLESPFDPDYLEYLLSEHGFHAIRRFVEVNGFFERSAAERDRVAAVFDGPLAVNILVCRREESAESLDPVEVDAHWEAALEVRDVAERPGGGPGWSLRVRVHNRGDSVWQAAPDLRHGSVALGVRLYDEAAVLLEENLGRTPLPRSVGPGESTDLTVDYPWSGPPVDRLVLDLVLQGVFWFGDRGSPTRSVDL